MSEDFSGTDLRNVVTDAEMLAIQEERDYIVQDDLTKAMWKVGEVKLEEKLEKSLEADSVSSDTNTSIKEFKD